MDRREIFNKYIQRPGEHSESVKPFVSDDTELCHGEKDRNQDEFLMDPTSNSITVNKVSRVRMVVGLSPSVAKFFFFIFALFFSG